MPVLLNVPYNSQRADGYCLPACVQMALAYLGILRSQEDLARTLGVIADLGVPASHIVRLRSRQIAAEYHTEGQLAEISAWLSRQIPVIACVQTSQLAYWHGHPAQHVVVLIGMDATNIYLLDPGQDESVITVSVGEFLLAWDEMAFAYAVLFSPLAP